jgi:hypothetical protein
MPDPNDIPPRRRVLVLDVTQAAAEVSRLTHEAYARPRVVPRGLAHEPASGGTDNVERTHRGHAHACLSGASASNAKSFVARHRSLVERKTALHL